MIIILHAALYMVDNPQVCWGLGIPPPASEQKKQSSLWPEEGINSWRVFVLMAHSFACVRFASFIIHVQVTTRLLCSSCPVVYWFAAHLITDHPKRSTGTISKENTDDRPECITNMTKRYTVFLLSEFPKPFWGQVVLSYFFLYFMIGIILYSNFLPWT
ncbi:GPI mannosyltransferase 2-like [Homarus americanus]|uniref:GPI mannosyltransferase 2-like n=1 Tax=Homarus americanus TaxID=6706 RepID=UPI001C438665|nr:GPI mannosyltransferase 2-like [Homarus americanus]